MLRLARKLLALQKDIRIKTVICFLFPASIVENLNINSVGFAAIFKLEWIHITRQKD